MTHEVTENIRRFGVGPAACDVAYRAASKLIPLTILKGMTAEARDVDPDWFMRGRVLTRFATDQEVLDAASRPEWSPALSRLTAEEYLDRGDRCVGCFDGDRLVSIGWYARRPTPISERHWLHFDPSWVYRHHWHTLPGYRGRKLHAAGMSWAVHQYTEEGAEGLISYVDATNLASLRSVQRMGYRIFGEICLAVVAGREITFASPGCRPYQFAVVSNGEFTVQGSEFKVQGSNPNLEP